MTNQPDDMPPWRHLENAERLLRHAEEVVARNLEMGERGVTDALLAALAHAVIAHVKTRKITGNRARKSPLDLPNRGFTDA